MTKYERNLALIIAALEDEARSWGLLQLTDVERERREAIARAWEAEELTSEELSRCASTLWLPDMPPSEMTRVLVALAFAANPVKAFSEVLKTLSPETVATLEELFDGARDGYLRNICGQDG